MTTGMLAFVVVAASALTITGWTAPTAAATAPVSQPSVGLEQALALSAAKKKQRVRRGGRYIACTPAGCRPVPPGCYPTPGYDWRGNPTGFDEIVCGPRRYYR